MCFCILSYEQVLKERYKDTGFPADIQALLDKVLI